MIRLDVWANNVKVGFFLLKDPSNLFAEWQEHQAMPEHPVSASDMSFHSQVDFLGWERRRRVNDWVVYLYFAKRGHYTYFNQDSEKIGTEGRDDYTVNIEHG